MRKNNILFWYLRNSALFKLYDCVSNNCFSLTKIVMMLRNIMVIRCKDRALHVLISGGTISTGKWLYQ
jgi:hypothetical protein